ncbi:uncharacterized protein LOC131665093 isoform X1 [Phymastichus coffea]|uniref:uncharacterized protein LOC131665093 isoform X1 n=1 Tax=Phymastichus coffea TaxID=108790 RepID=UPI00273B8AAB|nr:uncharacterized protein LOC131665093 isoform X1 [Phymastichus coffea]
MRIRADDQLLPLVPMVLVLVLVLGPSAAGESPLAESARRRIRALSYPEESQLGLFFALALPLDEPRSSQAVNVAFFFEANYKLPRDDDHDHDDDDDEEEQGETRRQRLGRAIDRTTLYRALESKFESLGLPGRQCLLRSICETARELRPEHRHNGLVGDLMRITFTPSTSESEEGADYPEYTSAEEHGTGDGLSDCAAIYWRCPLSIYQHITGTPE